MPENIVNLYGVIGEDVRAVDVKKALLDMDQTLPLVVKIDSEGGSVFDGFSIANAFSAYRGPKKAIVEPAAFSIASYIVAVFDEVEIAPNGYIMAHLPYTATEGTAAELANSSVVLADLEQKMIARYMQKLGKSEQEVRALLEKETFWNAEESVAMGLANRICQTGVATTRVQPSARHQNMPTKVYAALFGSAGLGGETRETTQEKPMSNTQSVAATVQDIKAAFPRAKSDFIVRCLERNLPLASVASAAAEEMMTENETLAMENEELKARCSAMEQELMAFKSKAEGEMLPEEEMPSAEVSIEYSPDEEEEMVAPAAKAKAKMRGAKPVARAGGSVPTALNRWNDLVAKEMAKGKRAPDAVLACASKYPGEHRQMLIEVNAR